MSSFTANSQMYNVVTENELSQVLSNYSSEFVLSVVRDMLNRRFQIFPIVTPANIVAGLEDNFKAIMAKYGPSSTEEVLRVRNDTYKEIIDEICREFKMIFTVDDTVDLYSAAYYLYDIFVCKFSSYLVSFFSNFIYREKDSLYSYVEASNKNKDVSTIYGKKLFKDAKIAVLNANIDFIVSDVICGMDIPFHSVVDHLYLPENLKSYILSIVSSGTEFFHDVYAVMLKSDIKVDIITAIRFNLQSFAKSDDQMLTGADVVNATSLLPEAE